jgi:hypothetical protein
MFDVKIEGFEALAKKLDKFAGQITALHTTMPDELEAWQHEDMKRKHPNMEVARGETQTTATTNIWPRSRMESKDQRRRFQGPKQHQPTKRGPVVRSNRPILRAELLQQLWDRMTKLTSEAMKWP